MKLIKNICLIIFIAITILFTVGYSALPIMKGTGTVTINPGTADTTASFTFYITHISNLINDAKDAYTSIDYSSISGITKTLFNTMLYSCIGVSILLSIGIILAMLGLKIISKIIFLITLIVMIAIVIMFLLIISKSTLVSYIPNMITNIIPGIQDSNITYDTGFLLMSAATILMFINFTIYSILA